MSLAAYRGTGQFGPAYRIMLERDSHAPGSVDRVLQQRMVRLGPETAPALYEGCTPLTVGYARGSRPAMERHRAAAGADRGEPEARVSAIARFCAALGEAGSDDLDDLVLGGTEKEIVARGSDWSTDVARVGCVLCQIAGLPARLAMLFDTAAAYSGHVIVEAHRGGGWGAVDTSTGVVYRHADGRPASVWQLMRDPELVAAHGEGFYSQPGQFRATALADYFAWQWRQHDYTVSRPNAYTRSILEMSARGWPGGLRWLHGEDAAPPASDG